LTNGEVAVWPKRLISQIALSYVAVVILSVLGWAVSRMPLLVEFQWRSPYSRRVLYLADSFGDGPPLVWYVWAPYVVLACVAATRVAHPRSVVAWLRVQSFAFPVWPAAVFVGTSIARINDGLSIGAAIHHATYQSLILMALTAAVLVALTVFFIERPLQPHA
jgi:hypothetical protein